MLTVHLMVQPRGWRITRVCKFQLVSNPTKTLFWGPSAIQLKPKPIQPKTKTGYCTTAADMKWNVCNGWDEEGLQALHSYCKLCTGGLQKTKSQLGSDPETLFCSKQTQACTTVAYVNMFQPKVHTGYLQTFPRTQQYKTELLFLLPWNLEYMNHPNIIGPIPAHFLPL